MILTVDAKLVSQTARSRISAQEALQGEPGDFTRCVHAYDSLPAPVLKLIRQITGAANGTSNTPPRMQVSTAYGLLTLEAKWLVPVGTLPWTPPGIRNPVSSQ